MPALPFVRSSSPGKLPGESEGRLVNGYPEKEGGSWLYRRVPGLYPWVNTGKAGGVRGMLNVNGTLYVAMTGFVVSVSPTLVVTVVGALAGSDPVTWARNNRADGPDIVVVRSSGGAYSVTSSTVAVYADNNVATLAQTVASLDGYFFFSLVDGRCFASGLNSVWVSEIDHTQNALAFATAESRPDALRRVIAVGNTLYLMGAGTIEPWQDIGSSPFPLARVPSVISVGLLSPMAVAGFEDGWQGNPLFVASDGSVRELVGYDTKPVSSSAVERFIAASTTSTLIACVYTFRSHAIWSLSSDRGTWAYDTATGAWHERESIGVLGWRGTCSVLNAAGQWVTGDRLSTFLNVIDEGTRSEPGAALVWTLESKPLKQFPVRAAVNDLFADFALAAADTASNPQVAITCSKDAGKSWSGTRMRFLAAEVIRVLRLGLARAQGFQVRFSVSDPVDFSFSGASTERPEPRSP